MHKLSFLFNFCCINDDSAQKCKQTINIYGRMTRKAGMIEGTRIFIKDLKRLVSRRTIRSFSG